MTSKTRITCSVFFALISICGLTYAQDAEIDKLMAEVRVEPTSDNDLSYVRESILKEAATTLGSREGLRARSCLINKEIEPRRAALDKKYRFSDLMMGKGVLPPIISEAKDAMSLTEKALRVASMVYQIDEPARLVVLPPTWRDWLYVGLPMDACEQPVQLSADEKLSAQHRPRTPQEEKYFRMILKASYLQGIELAQSIFDVNRARLDRAYIGMRRYFDIYQRGMVSAPIIVSGTDIVNNDDPDVLIVGDTLIRITRQAAFVPSPDRWVPLDRDDRKNPGNPPGKQGVVSSPAVSAVIQPEPVSSAALNTLALDAGEEVVSPVKSARPGAARGKWQVRSSDGQLSVLLDRWAESEGWRVVWMGARDIRVVKDDEISQPDFLSAATHLISSLRSGGYPIQFRQTGDKVLEISATRN